MIRLALTILSLSVLGCSSQHCSATDGGFRSLTCYRLTNAVISRAPGVQTSKYFFRTFRCVNCALSVIMPNSFNVGTAAKASFRSMDLSGCGVTEVKVHGFAYQGAVRELSLARNAIKVLYQSNFNDLASLERLDLSDNMVEKLTANTFTGLNYLRVLNLEGNSLSSITNNAFDDLVELELLNLNRNKLTMLRYGMFLGLTTLNSLLVGHNSIQLIDPQAFSGLSELARIDLGANKLINTSQELLDVSRHLRVLNLSDNPLSSFALQSDTIEELHLSNISLGSLEALDCRLPSLRLLNLSSNSLASLPLSYFVQFPLLQRLALANSSIAQVNASGKLQLRALRYLDLGFNNLTDFDYEGLMGCAPLLAAVDLGGNSLCAVVEEMKEVFEASGVALEAGGQRGCNGSGAVQEGTVAPTTTVDGGVVCPKGAVCRCADDGKGFVVVCVMFVVILVVLFLGMMVQCFCRARSGYGVNSANLPLVNLSKD